MDKRNKFWRRQQMARVFKVRMIFYASCGNRVIHDDGSVVRMEAIMNILIGLSWQKKNGQKFIRLQVFHVVVGCVEGRSTIVGNIRKRCCVLLKNH